MTGFFKDQRGSAYILTLLMVICFFAVTALVTDVGKHFCLKVAMKNKLDLAVRSAAAQIDEEELKNAGLVIDEAGAAQTFYGTLKMNLLLDDSLSPLAGSMLNSGPVRIDYFKVIKPEEIPFTYTFNGYSETVSQVSVVAIISFPVKSGAFSRLAGLPEETTMYCHVTAGPELISRPVDQI